MKTKIQVEIKDVEVDERYYSFNFVVTMDGVVVGEGVYSNDYENGDTPEEWRGTLIDGGEAVKLAVVNTFEQLPT